MTYLVYDLIILALLLFFLWRGYHTGFVLTLCGTLAVFVAFIGATVVSNTLAEPVSRTVRPLVEETLCQLWVEEELMATTSILDSSALTDLQIPLEEALAVLRDDPWFQGFAGAIQESLDSGMVAATANATRLISEYVALQLAEVVLFLVSFLLILVLWSIFSRMLDLAFKLPVLSTLNRWSGGALGLLKGALLIFIACQLLKGSFLPQEAIRQSVLLKQFCAFSPMTLFS